MWWNPFRARRAHQLQLAQLQADQTKYLADALKALADNQTSSLAKVGEMVSTLAEGQSKTANVLQTWLDQFKVYEQPVSHTIREEDEVRMESDRALPEGIPPELALAWRLRQHDSDLT
jgi:hypothetical protein